VPLVPTPKNCDASVKKAIQILTQKLGLKSVPIHAGLTLTDLTASTLIGANASKALESVTVSTGLDYTRPTLSLSHLGIEDLTDADADKIMFWDDHLSACGWLVPNTLISITGTNLNVDNDLHNYSWTNVDATDLKVGSVTQAWDAQLDDIAALAVTDGNFIVGDNTNWVAESGATVRTSIGLGNVENTQLSTWAGTTNITTLGTITTVGNITIANGGTIGQAAGPLLTFNDTTNKLGITGCFVGIGELTPDSPLHITSTTLPAIKLEWLQTTASAGLSCFQTATYMGGFSAFGSDYAANVFWQDAMVITAANNNVGKIIFRTKTSNNYQERMVIINSGGVLLKEQASAGGDVANYGQIWVKSDAPNTLWFTDDTGVDYQIGGGSGSRCSVYLSGNQTITLETWTKIAFNSEDYDTNGEFDTTNNKFVVGSTGYYTVHYRIIGLAMIDGKFLRAILYKNKGEGSEESLMDCIRYSDEPATSVYIPCSDDIYLEAGDELELWVYQNSASTINLHGGSLQRLTMSIHRFA